MALTSPLNSPLPGPATPTPYRTDTAAVLTWQPRALTRTEQISIQQRIYPTPRRWWQFELPPMPWQAVLAFRVWFSTVVIGAVGIAAYLYLGAHR